MKYIDLKEIYNLTDGGLEIFKFYFPNQDITNPKLFVKLRNEKTASAKIGFFKGLWRITDFGNEQEVRGMTGVDFVKYQEGLEFVNALKFVEDVILKRSVGGGEFKPRKFSAEYDSRELTKEDKKGEYRFTYKSKSEITESDLHAIGRYVTAELLERFNCRVLKQYEYCSYSKKRKKDVVHIFKATEDYPMFVFDYGSFKKLYKPHDPDKKYRFVYIGEKPKDYIYGLEQIEDASDEFSSEEEDEKRSDEKPDMKVNDIFRCSGESDALNVASLDDNYHVYWLNSESAEMTYDQYQRVDKLCKNHYQILDLDATGKQNARKFALRHINMMTIELPEWLKKKTDWRGNACKDIKDYINTQGHDLESTKRGFAHLKRTAKPMKFWEKVTEKDKDGNVKKQTYNINLEYFYYFLAANGFFVMDSKYHRKAGYCYAHVKGKVIDLIHPDDIKKVVKRFTKEWIKSKGLMDEIKILNKINQSAQINESNLQEIERINPEFFNHDKDTEYLHFNNGTLKITPDSIERVKNEEVPNNILGKLEISDKTISHVIPHNVRKLREPIVSVTPTPEFQKLLDKRNSAKDETEREQANIQISAFDDLDKYDLTINDDKFIFVQFLRDLSRIHWREEEEKKQKLTEKQKKEEKLLFINMLYVIGYNVAQYKDPAKPWLTFMQDMKITQVGKSSGRSGKSLLSAAIGYVRPSFYIGGRRKDITEKTEFIYDGYTKFHNNLEVDDLYEYANFDFFYTQVTGKREVNSKFISKQILDYHESGKMLISSNFELQSIDPSTLARILNVAVSDYYHERTKYNDYLESRNPITKFGRRIYDDFTEEEWVKFYNLIAYAIQMYQKFDKIQPPMANLEKRQLRREMTRGLGRDEEFWIWANSYFKTKPEDYTDEYSPIDKDYQYFDTYMVKEKLFDDFVATLPKNLASRYKVNTFKKAISAFCDYYGFDMNPNELCNSGTPGNLNRIMKSHPDPLENKTVEMIYIDTQKSALRKEEPKQDESTQGDEDSEDNLPF